MNQQHLEVFAGEDRTLTLYARDASNVAASLTGKSVEWLAGRSPRYRDSTWPILTKTGTVTDAANGVFTVPILAADTAYMAGDYEHQAETTVTGSGLKAIVTIGRFRVRPTMGV